MNPTHDWFLAEPGACVSRLTEEQSRQRCKVLRPFRRSWLIFVVLAVALLFVIGVLAAHNRAINFRQSDDDFDYFQNELFIARFLTVPINSQNREVCAPDRDPQVSFTLG
jgi:hypothetical protein